MLDESVVEDAPAIFHWYSEEPCDPGRNITVYSGEWSVEQKYFPDSVGVGPLEPCKPNINRNVKSEW